MVQFSPNEYRVRLKHSTKTSSVYADWSLADIPQHFNAVSLVLGIQVEPVLVCECVCSCMRPTLHRGESTAYLAASAGEVNSPARSYTASFRSWLRLPTELSPTPPPTPSLPAHLLHPCTRVYHTHRCCHTARTQLILYRRRAVLPCHNTLT